MHFLYQLQFLNEFRCIGGKCPQTCCSGWDIALDEQDVHYYQKNPNILGDLRDNCDFEALKMHRTNNRCSNLNEEGLCQLQLLSTHKALPLTCKLYPRIFIQHDTDLFAIASLSCPEIVNMLYEHSKKAEPQSDIFLPPKQISSKIKTIPRKTTVHFTHTDTYLKILSFIERDQISSFLQKHQELFHTIIDQRFVSQTNDPTIQTLSNTTLIMITHLQNEYLHSHLLSTQHISADVFLHQTQQRFLLLPPETRDIIRNFFWKTFVVHSISALQKNSLKEAILWQSTYMTFFFIIGIWNETYSEIGSWKELVYRFGRFFHANIPITKTPFVDIHTTMMPFFYQMLYPPSDLS